MQQTFAGIEEEYAQYETSAILLQSIPYDGTSTWGKGADKAWDAFLEAAANMEVYDIETDSEVYTNGIHILPQILEKESPEKVYEAVYTKTKELLKSNKFLTFFGGEHSISIGVIKAFYEHYDDLTVVQFDAHADLRPEYMGSPFNHACALHDASKNTNLLQVGIRSMDSVEKPFLNRHQCFFAQHLHHQQGWMDQVLMRSTDKVYITIDLDVFDPAIMPSTGTPEPDGLNYHQVVDMLRLLFMHKEVVGFDIVELAPIDGLRAPNFLAAKLYYQMLSFKFHNYGK
jgi:agmatinase